MADHVAKRRTTDGITKKSSRGGVGGDDLAAIEDDRRFAQSFDEGGRVQQHIHHAAVD